jgi:hypothetical protein
MLCVGNALAYTAYSYGTQYPDISTRASAQYVNGQLNSIGYSSTYRQDYSAGNAIQDMRNANVWFFNGHGGNGYASFYYPGYTYITGYRSTDIDYPISRWSDGTLNDVALSVFVSCGSGNSDSTYGNLLDQSISNGVDTAVGFSGTLEATRSDYWAQQFSIHLNEQKTIYQSMQEATSDVYYLYWSYGGTNTYVIRGATSVTIDPARAGN